MSTIQNEEALFAQAELVLSNPFEEASGRAEAEASIGSSGIPAILGLHESGRDKQARRLAVALALVELNAGREPAFLESRGKHADLLSRIGLDSKAAMDTSAAAARCQSVLSELAGTSKAIAEVRSRYAC